MPYEALASHRGRNRCGAGRTTKASPLGDKTTVHIAIISLGIDSRQDKNLMGGGLTKTTDSTDGRGSTIARRRRTQFRNRQL